MSELFPISRAEARAQLDTDHNFAGYDLWTCYEVSWLTPSGKPTFEGLSIWVPADSLCLIESKSLKLFLNSLNDQVFESPEEFFGFVARKISRAISGGDEIVEKLKMTMHNVRNFSDSLAPASWHSDDSVCLDCLPINNVPGSPSKSILSSSDGGQETEYTAAGDVYTDLFRSTCPMTGLPDWASVRVLYKNSADGRRPLDRASVLKYLLSFREHGAFHENCVEMIYSDLLAVYKPEELVVIARFNRRGGIDINPMRFSDWSLAEKYTERFKGRLYRQ